MIFIINGATSSGKTTISRELIKELEEPFLYFNFDYIVPSLFPDMREESTIRKLNREMIPKLQKAQLLDNVERAVNHSISSYVKYGFNIIIDTVLWPEDSTLGDILEAGKETDIYKIGIFCELEELERREKERGDRRVGNAKKQFDVIHSNINYDFTLNSSNDSLEENVNKLKSFITGYLE